MVPTRRARLVVGCPAGCRRTLVLGALVALCAVSPVALAAPPWRPDRPLASHAMLYLDAPYSFKQSMFKQSADLGASSIRVDLALSAVFAADGSAHWEPVDEVMALARAYRLRPVGIVLATPWFISACPAQAQSHKCPPSDLEAWKRMVSEMAAHTRGVIDTFEILNEPDGRWAFAGTAADYATLLRAGHDAVLAANPRARVAIAATMSLRSRAWLELVLGAAGPHPEGLYDIANIHVRASLRALPAIMPAWRAFFAATMPPTSRCGSPSSVTRPTPPTSTTAHTDPAPPPKPPISPARSPPCSPPARRRCSSPCATTSPVSSPPRESLPARSATRRGPTRWSCANPPSPRSAAPRVRDDHGSADTCARNTEPAEVPPA